MDQIIKNKILSLFCIITCTILFSIFLGYITVNYNTFTFICIIFIQFVSLFIINKKILKELSTQYSDNKKNTDTIVNFNDKYPESITKYNNELPETPKTDNSSDFPSPRSNNSEEYNVKYITVQESNPKPSSCTVM